MNCIGILKSVSYDMPIDIATYREHVLLSYQVCASVAQTINHRIVELIFDAVNRYEA
jgi:hypothetical protein